MPSLRRCPFSQITDQVWEILQWWGEFKELGALPWGGSDLMEQPAYVLEAFNMCIELKGKIELEGHKKSEREREQWQRRNAKSASRSS